MATATSRKIFVNLAVADLKKSVAFFSALGFTFNPKFTNDDGACMIVSGEAFVMLLTKPHFRSFTKREPADTTTVTEGMFAFSCDSRAEVDEVMNKAVAAGGRQAMAPQDMGFMYGRTFYDLDGHHWELFWMDPAAV